MKQGGTEMIIGYARVSTTEQNLDRQILALGEAGCETIYQEKITGTKKDRPELQSMLGSLKAGDTVIVKELTRISRSTSDLLELVQSIADKGAYIKSLNESWLDTSTPAGELMLTIFAGMAQFERKLMLQRCNEGRAVAIAKGVRMGRPKVMDKQMDYAIQLYKNGEMSIRTICDVTGVAKATFCRRLKELKVQKGQDKNKVKITA
jgi:DNA invertase Pin-like site-specific DNA recombinase